MRSKSDSKTVDQSALRMMLSYIEAECLRLGAVAAAEHAAMAAALVTRPGEFAVAGPIGAVH